MMGFQRRKAKELQEYFKQKKLEEADQGPFFGSLLRMKFPMAGYFLDYAALKPPHPLQFRSSKAFRNYIAMGCAQTKPSMDSPPRGLQKLKLESGYVKGGYDGPRRSIGQRLLGKDPGRFSRPGMRDKSSDSGGGGGRASVGSRGSREGKLITREGHREKSSGGGGSSSSGGGGRGRSGGGDRSGGGGDRDEGKVSQRLKSSKAGEEDELVDGWPKWLTDNIPRDALDGLVPKSAESYDKLDKVGQGTYSNVYKARDRATGKIVALKKVRFDTSEPESVKFMAREIRILRKLDHPNIVKLEGLATSRMLYSLYLVFDYMQSDLAKIISRPDQRLTEPQVKCYMNQLLSGLQHCHERGLLHRDIKGSNLLIDKNGMLKIADFGLANFFNPEKKRPLTSRVVTLWYRAPELLLGATDYGVGIDLWSAGCLMAEMFAGRPIMPARTEVEQLHRIFKLCGTPAEDYWKKIKVSTTFRPPQTYKHSVREAFRGFPPSSLGLLNILLALDPASRGSAGSALQNEFFHTWPLACDLSGLPVVYKGDDETTQSNERRKHRQHSRKQRERRRKDQASEKPKGDSASSKELTICDLRDLEDLLSVKSCANADLKNFQQPENVVEPIAKSQEPRSSLDVHIHQNFNVQFLLCDKSEKLLVTFCEQKQETLGHRQHSRKQRERRRKDQASEKPKGDSASSKELTICDLRDLEDLLSVKSCANADLKNFQQPENVVEPIAKSQEPRSSTTSTSSSTKPIREESSPPLPFLLESPPQKLSPRSEAHPNATKNIKNLPPLPNAKRSTINCNGTNENMYRLNQFFHTWPLACDLSGLPVVYKGDDETTQSNERRKHRQHSRKQRERRRKDQASEKPKGDSASSKELTICDLRDLEDLLSVKSCANADLKNFQQPENVVEPIAKSQEPRSSTTSTSSSTKPIREESSPPLPFLLESPPQKLSPRSEAHPNATKNIKNLPPLPNAKRSTINCNGTNENMYRLNQVQRSVSTREFRKVHQRKLHKLPDLDD
ncbi:unnamed protein product [Ilex paraguariensis]|uniref:Protein kinase domain-containing protein n=1 Tax=Ilex paraguariensis TaxID=185542 RepID=A0ABC8SBJ7_9AQUA